MSDLLEIMQEDGFPARRVSAAYGGEWHSRCPFCHRETGDGGDDRFVVHPNKSDCGNYFCRRQPEHHKGDGIHYLREYRDMDFATACATLGVTRKPKGNGRGKAAAKTQAWTPRPAEIPPAAWRTQARELVREAEGALIRSACDLMILKRRRFLDIDSVRAAHLGIVRKTRWSPKADWGIAPEEDDRPNLWIPSGLLIPAFSDGEITALSIRRSRDEDPRYIKVSGSCGMCPWFGPSGKDARAVVVVESALDAVLLHQELPGDIAVAALGSASARPDADTAHRMKELPLVLVALDGDDAGAANASGWWKEHFANASRLAYPKRYGAKDPTELAVAVGSTEILRMWVEAGIEIAKSHRAAKPAPKPLGKTRTATRMQRPLPQPAVAAPDPPETARRQSTVEAGPSLDMRVTFVEDAAAMEAALARIADFSGVIGLDAETTPLPQFINEEKAALDPYKSRARTIQVCTGNDVFVFDMNHVDIRVLAPVAAHAWAGHNSVFDLKVLTHAGIESATPDCTMLLGNSIEYNGMPSLRDLASKHLGVVLDKAARTEDWSGDLSPAQVEYAARDAWATFRLHERLAAHAERRGLMRLYYLMKGAQPVVAAMGLAGLGFDREAHARIVDGWKAELKIALSGVRDAFGDGFNPNSATHINAWLKANLDPELLAAWPRTKSGALSTAADDLAIGIDLLDFSFIVAARGFAHALAGFGETLASLVHPVTGRLHPHLMIAAQSTGRFSCTGPNMAGIPRDPRVRALFVCAPGRRMVSADYSTVQVRLAALESRDPRLLDAIKRGLDLHSLTASLIMGKRPEQVSAGERSLVKPVNFGLLFCMGSQTLWRYARSQFHVNMSLGDAARFRDAYFRAYPGIRGWHNRVRDELADCGKVRTPCGRWCAPNASLPTAAAHVIQGAEAEVMLSALGRLPDALRGLDAVPVACIHDEILLDVAEADVAATEAAVRDAMEGGMRDVYPNAPLIGLVEAHHGPSWNAAK